MRTQQSEYATDDVDWYNAQRHTRHDKEWRFADFFSPVLFANVISQRVNAISIALKYSDHLYSNFFF